MAGKKIFPNGTIQYTFKRVGLLDKPIYLTFDNEAEGDAFAKRLDLLLDNGIVPTEYQAKSGTTTVGELIRQYERDGHPSAKDCGVLRTVYATHADDRIAAINVDWVDNWISDMKRIDKLVPSTIRSKIGAMARCTDWGLRKKILLLPDSPFRTLPDGYSQYTEADAKVAGEKKVDAQRDRRLEDGEFEKVLAMIKVGVLPRKQRPLKLEHQAALRCLFILAPESAMRLREMYTLTLDQVSLTKTTVFLEKTKNGDKRQVPLSKPAKAAIVEYLLVRQIPEGHPKDMLFPWWDGDTSLKALHKLTDYLSSLYEGIFEAAGCAGLRFHDLRHEGVSRLFERTNLTDTEIMKISGHKTHSQIMRYLNLRGSMVASRLW